MLCKLYVAICDDGSCYLMKYCESHNEWFIVNNLGPGRDSQLAGLTQMTGLLGRTPVQRDVTMNLHDIRLFKDANIVFRYDPKATYTQHLRRTITRLVPLIDPNDQNQLLL